MLPLCSLGIEMEPSTQGPVRQEASGCPREGQRRILHHIVAGDGAGSKQLRGRHGQQEEAPSVSRQMLAGLLIGREEVSHSYPVTHKSSQ